MEDILSCASEGYPPAFGGISGTACDWHAANFKNIGRAHNHEYVREGLTSAGLQSFFASDPPFERLAKKYFNQSLPALSISEPCIIGAHSSYYNRRGTSIEDVYRRSTKLAPEPLIFDKPEGKKYSREPIVPASHNSGKRLGPDFIVNKEPEFLPEPGMPRLLRPIGLEGLRESDMEVDFEGLLGRKVRVDSDSFRGQGRAGDLTGSLGAPARPEDDPLFFKTLHDSPTFLRFCSSLPAKPAVSPHERRAASLRRAHDAERDRERTLVASLQLPDI